MNILAFTCGADMIIDKGFGSYFPLRACLFLSLAAWWICALVIVCPGVLDLARSLSGSSILVSGSLGSLGSFSSGRVYKIGSFRTSFPGRPAGRSPSFVSPPGIPQFVMHAKVPFNVEENTIVSKQVGSHRKQV